MVAGYYKDISDQMLNSTINFLNKKLKYQIIALEFLKFLLWYLKILKNIME